MQYSIVIRTLGQAGEKYQRMLGCIENLRIKPNEVLVVIPNGFPLPKERLGFEQFIRSDKGMVRQRCVGGHAAKSKYILFLDDDLEFDSDFVDQLAEPIERGVADISFAWLPELLPQRKHIINSAIAGSAVPMLFNKQHNYLRILRSGGYAYNKDLKRDNGRYYYAQTAPGACFLIKKNDFKEIHFEDELWLEANGYAMGEDQVFFYKAYCYGYKAMCVPSVRFVHLDASTSTGGNFERVAFGAGWFKYIFWKRYIYEPDSKSFLRYVDAVAFCWCYYANVAINFLKSKINKNKKVYLYHFKKGIKAAKGFTKSSEYEKLLKIQKK